MKVLAHDDSTPLYVPDYVAQSVEDIDFKTLAKNGVRFVAFDADSTLVPYRGIEIAATTRQYLRQQRKLFEKWCVASNRVTNDLQPLADSIGAGVVRASWRQRKPQRRYFERVLGYLGAGSPRQVVMIGDKLLADVWGAKRAGFITVWVEHLGPDSLPDRLILRRPIERRFLEKYIV